MRLRKNQSGYAFFTVLVLITILGILFTFMLRDIQLVRFQSIREVHRVQSHLLAESGITKAEYLLNGNDSHDLLWEGGSVDSLPQFGSISVESRRFGLFSQIKSFGKRVRTTCCISAFAGRTVPKECLPVLVLHGKAGGMALMPGSKIRGTVVLSRGRICKGETVQEVRDSGLVVVRQEMKTLPFDSSQVITVIEKLSRDQAVVCSVKTARAGNVVLVSETDTIIRSDTLFVKGDCRIEKGSYSNKMIFATGGIAIAKDAECTRCVFLSEKVSVEGGVTDKCLFYSAKRLSISAGKHNSQFFGSDSITISGNPTFGPMSVVLLRREGVADSAAAIFLSPKTILSGTIICCSDTIARMRTKIPSVIFGAGIVFHGVCMTDGDIDVSDSQIKGHLWARSILTARNNRAYVNFLFNVKLEQPKVDGVFPLIGSAPLRLVMEQVSEEFAVKKRVLK
jgi:hypothetical protein